MLKAIWDTAVLIPARYLADFIVIGLAFAPVAAGAMTWIGIYKLLAKKSFPAEILHRWQLWPSICAWICAPYVAVITGVALGRLPEAITQILNSAD